MAREPFNRTWNEEPDAPDQYREPDNTVWQQGWRGGAIEEPPKAWYQNWWQRRVDVALQAIERLGALTWDNEARYRVGAIAVASNGFKYLAVSGTEQSPNVGNDPALDTGANWLPYYDSGIPGKIEIFAMQSPPAGYLKCNGQSVSRADYARLFLAIGTVFGNGNGSTTFNIPDLRGQFIRGWDDNKGVDAGRSFGSNQSDTLQNITGSINNIQSASGTAGFAGESDGAFRSLNVRNDPIINNIGDATRYSTLSFDASRIVRTSSETRPKNISLLTCIKY